MDRYAVIGNPVEHSLSPVIHGEFARQTGERIHYEKLLAPLDAFDETVAGFFAASGRGVNVTVPFKEQAAKWVQRLEGDAVSAGVVNTIVDRDGAWVGFNTDGVGLVRDITVNQERSLEGRRVLLLGAGGAARGVVRPLLAQNPAELTVANRGVARAQALVAALEDWARETRCGACALDEVTGEFDVVINATSAGLAGRGDLLAATSVRGAFCYDLVYAAGAAQTPFCAWATGAGAGAVSDGLGMLVEQAAEAFRLWRGVRPATAEVMALLRRK